MVLSSELLASILDEVRPLLGQGKVADYIPALAQVPTDRLDRRLYRGRGAVHRR